MHKHEYLTKKNKNKSNRKPTNDSDAFVNRFDMNYDFQIQENIKKNNIKVPLYQMEFRFILPRNYTLP